MTKMSEVATKMSEVAIDECVVELRAACRRPIDQQALETMLTWVRADFERILDRQDGKKRWADLGARVRETGRFLGSLSEFFSSHTGTQVVGLEELTNAMRMVRADCTVRAESTPVAWQFCSSVPLNIRPAQEFLRAVAPPSLVRLAG